MSDVAPARDQGGARWPGWRWLAVGALAYLALLLALLWPATQGGHAALGAPTRDLFDHLWLHDWLGDSLVGGGELLHTQALAWPTGGRLMHPDPVGWLLYAGLAPLLGAVGAYDAMLVLQLWLAALAAWLLGARVAGSTVAGWLAGLAFGLSPFLLGQALGGESETVAAWPLVLALWALERCAERRGWRDALLAGALGALTAVASWYYGAFFGVYTVAWALLRCRTRVALVALGSFGLLALGPALLYGDMLGDGANLFQGPSLATYLSDHPHTLAGMVGDPAGWLGFFPGLLEAAGHPRVQYLGTVALLLALAGAVLPGARGRGWWAGVGLAALALSLGPALHFGGRALMLGDAGVPGPLATLSWLPLVGLMRIPHRWILLAALAMAVLAARGLRLLAGDDLPPPGGAGRCLPRLHVALVLSSVLLISDVCLFADLPGRGLCSVPAVTGLDAPPEIHRQLPGRGAVLDLPPRMMDDDARGRYLVWQRLHGRPVPYSLLMTGISEPLATEPLVAAIAAIDRRDPIARQPEQAAQFRRRDLALLAHAFRVGERGEAELAGAGQRLATLGIDAVVLHGELLEAEDAAAAEALIRGLLGEPVASVGQGRAWALEGAP
jgi:hypothetical protein